MLDDIGLGNTLANLIYVVILIFGILGAWFFVKRKIIEGVIFWISSILNFLFYLYLMGNYSLYPKLFYPIVNKYWPWINLVLLILLIVNYLRNKKKNSQNQK
jgi:hypothetical protein